MKNDAQLKDDIEQELRRDPSAVAVYSNHAAAEEAVKELQKSGFDLKTD